MEKFLALTEKKRNTIINSALLCFGKYGYEKASINDIASGSGISKASIFQYFGNKKALYNYLIDYSTSQMKSAYNLDKLNECDDFFDKVLLASEMKVENLKRHPNIAQFIIQVMREREQSEFMLDKEDWQPFVEQMIMREEDFKKFKNEDYANTVFKTLMLLAQGMSMSFEEGNYDEIMKEFENILNMLKDNLYKEEYL